MLALNGKDLASRGPKHFQTAVNYAPEHDRALVELGFVQLETSQWNSAVQTLERALQVNTASSGHTCCSRCYAQLPQLFESQEHASAPRSTAPKCSAGENVAPQILAAEGNREGAKQEFEAVARDFLTHLARRLLTKVCNVSTS